jgi:iron(III) transport system permease protein
MSFGGNRLISLVLLLIGLSTALPVLAVFVSWFGADASSWQILGEIGASVLPQYAWNSVLLCLLVGAGVTVVGTVSAAAVTLFEFPLRRVFEWGLLLPMAMPAYVVAYAYTDFFQFAGPAQTMLRETFGWQGRLLPDVRSLGGAVWVFTFTLYPYVYLLARTALAERAPQLMEAARLLGASLSRRILNVALPLARPAVAAGLALALMETLADFGVSSYFGLQTFTAGIYKAWLAMDNRIAAAQLATMLVLIVALLLGLERRAQGRMRFANPRGARPDAAEARPVRLRGSARWLAFVVCAFPMLAGFVFPTLFMLRPLLAQGTELPWGRFAQWTFNSLSLGLASAALAVALALFLAFRVRRQPDRATRGVTHLVGLGYALPGAVLVVGILLPLAWLQDAAPSLHIGQWASASALLLIWAYLARFTSVALQSVQSGYSRITPSTDDSARMLGAGGWSLFARLHWPLLRRSTYAAILLVLVDVMKELPATLVLRPFDMDTLAVMAYQLARDERLGEAALPSLALVLAGLVPVLLLSRALRNPAVRLVPPTGIEPVSSA